MKLICSLNGLDGCGKTTQIEKFQSEYYDIIDVFGDLAEYEGFPKLEGQELHNWWFKESTISEFCDSIYESLSNRNKAILDSSKSIILLDKGIYNFEIRVIATLLTRGYEIKKIYNEMQKSKEKFDFIDIENIKILLYRDKMVKEKIQEETYTEQEQSVYLDYQTKQIEILRDYKNKFSYYINSVLNINQIYEQIKKIIITNYYQELIKDNNYINIQKEILAKVKLRQNSLCEQDYFVSVIDIFNQFQAQNNINFSKNNNFVDLKNIKIKNIEEFNIPKFYKNILKDLLEEIYNEVLGVKLILLHGSAGRECMHLGWSDLDIIIVLDEYKFRELNKIDHIISKYKSDVKIGTTIYSKNEIKNLLIDAKTLYALYQMENGQLYPNVCEDFEVPYIAYEDLLEKNYAVLPEAIHKLKRLLYSSEEINKVSIIKTLNLIMKVKLIDKYIFCKSYEEVFSNYSKVYNVEYLDVSEYLNNEKTNIENLKEYAKYIIEKMVD